MRIFPDQVQRWLDLSSGRFLRVRSYRVLLLGGVPKIAEATSTYPSGVSESISRNISSKFSPTAKCASDTPEGILRIQDTSAVSERCELQRGTPSCGGWILQKPSRVTFVTHHVRDSHLARQ